MATLVSVPKAIPVEGAHWQEKPATQATALTVEAAQIQSLDPAASVPWHSLVTGANMVGILCFSPSPSPSLSLSAH